MRRILALLMAVLTIGLLAACGSSGSGAAPANPQLRALSYFPANSPFVMTVATAAGSSSARQIQALEHANPSYALAITALYGRLSQLGVDYSADIRPLFGNPIAFGLGAEHGGTNSVLAAWVTHSAAALHRLIGKLHSLHPAGHADGAALYASGNTAVAVTGPTLVLARTLADLRAALTRSAAHQGIGQSQFTADTARIPTGGAFQAFGDLTGPLSTAKTASARKVPWVAAIRSYGASIGVSGHTVTMHFVLNTGGRSLTPSQLPLASGSLGPALTGPAPIEAGIRDPAQMISFVLDAMRLSSPSQYAKFLKGETEFHRATGVNASTVESMLTGSLDVDSDGHATIARADVTNPAEAARLLARLAADPSALGGHNRLVPAGGGFYRAQHGSKTTYVGVSHGRVVVGTAPLASIVGFAAASAGPPTQGGAVAFKVALGQLIALGLARSSAAPGLPPALAARLISAVGALTGTVQATTSGLSGTAVIPFHPVSLSPSG